MPRGGPRVGAGRPRKTPKVEKASSPVAQAVDVVSPADVEVVPAGMTPLAYMLGVMNDPEADAGRRDRLAVAAAPYLHPKVAEIGKKDARKGAASEAKQGKFAPAIAPRLVHSR